MGRLHNELENIVGDEAIALIAEQMNVPAPPASESSIQAGL